MNLDKMDPDSMGNYLSDNRIAINEKLSPGEKMTSFSSFILDQNKQLRETIDDLYRDCINVAVQTSISSHIDPAGVQSNRFEHDEIYQTISGGQKLFLSSIQEEHRQYCERMLKNLHLQTVIYCLENLPDSYQEILIEFYIDQKRCYELSSAGKGTSQSSKDRGKKTALRELCAEYNHYITTNENLPVIINSIENTIADFQNYIDKRFLF